MSTEPKSPGEAKSLHKETIALGNREYTFEYRESARGNRFLNVTDAHERNGKPTRDSILVFEEQLGPFMEALQRVAYFTHQNKK
jgi:hypothetical protein